MVYIIYMRGIRYTTIIKYIHKLFRRQCAIHNLYNFVLHAKSGVKKIKTNRKHETCISWQYIMCYLTGKKIIVFFYIKRKLPLGIRCLYKRMRLKHSILFIKVIIFHQMIYIQYFYSVAGLCL